MWDERSLRVACQHILQPHRATYCSSPTTLGSLQFAYFLWIFLNDSILFQEEKSCPYYIRTGSCKFGVACKFDHPQPGSAGTVVPVPVPPAYGSTGLSIVPSSAGLPYDGGPQTWSLPRPTYLSGPRAQGPQTYLPVVLSSSQGIVPAHGWNTYTVSTLWY